MPAKISAPRLTEAYRRSRVFRALDAARRKKAVWVTAPAGAGKTSAITTYLAARKLPALWYNVDARDSDPANLFYYLTLGAELASPRRKLKLPTYSAENQLGVSAFARGYFEALYATRPMPSVIVLDDYQDAGSELFDEVVREAIAALPRGISAMFVSRTEPPPLLVRQVASGDVGLVDVSELRLTPEDTAGLVRLYRPELRGAPLKRALPRIVELANGWAAALTLLLQSGKPVDFDPHAVDQFSERLFDYFATEVFDKATAAERDFLLRTAVAPNLDVALAARLSGVDDARRVLGDLERRSFLIQRLGASDSYRYHPLLRGFLLRRAKLDLGDTALSLLHRGAAQSFVEAGQMDEAIEQFEIADDVAERVRLLLGLAASYVATGRSRTIARWIARLPSTWREQNGWLAYWQAVSSFGYWDERPGDLLERAYALFVRDGDEGGLYLSCAAGMQAVVQEGIDFTRLDSWIERFESLEKEGRVCPPPFLPMVATGMMMASAFRRSDAAHNRKWVARATELSAQSDDVVHRGITDGFAALYYAMYDGPARAAATLDTLRALASRATSSSLVAITVVRADALCCWLRGDNEMCIEETRKTLAMADRTGIFLWNDFMLGLGVGAALGREDFASARDFLEPMAKIAAERGGWPAGVNFFHVGLDALARGDIAKAIPSAELASATADAQGPPFGRAVNPLLLAQVYAYRERAHDAKAALAIAKQRAEEMECAVLLYACLLVESDLAWNENREKALTSLRRGFALARERGLHNAFGLDRKTLTRCAVRAIEHGVELDHVRESILKLPLEPERVPPRFEAWPWRYRFRTFGTFEITRAVPADGASVSRKVPELRGMPLRLLQAILISGPRGARDTQIIDALWPDAEGHAGRRVFDTTLHRLRRQLGDYDILRLSDGRLSIDPRVCWLDIWALDDLAIEIDRQLADAPSVTALMELARRLDEIYRGPLLHDGLAETWVVGPRARCAAKFDRLVRSIVEALERNGERESALALHARAT